MIKRKLIFALLSVICLLTVFGTGYALWTFDGSSSSSSTNLGVTITQTAKLGTFSAPAINYVVFDGGVNSDVNSNITGLSFYKGVEGGTVDTNNSFHITFKVDSVYLAQLKENDNWKNVNFGIRVKVPEGLESLITHTEFYNLRVLANGYVDLKQLAIDLTDHFDDPDLTKSDFSYDAEKGVFTFALTTGALGRFFTYIDSAKPNNLENYDNLNANVAAKFTIELWQGYSAN